MYAYSTCSARHPVSLGSEREMNGERDRDTTRIAGGPQCARLDGLDELDVVRAAESNPGTAFTQGQAAT